MLTRHLVLLSLVLTLAACAAPTATEAPASATPLPPPTQTATPAATLTPTLTPTATFTPSPTPVPTTITQQFGDGHSIDMLLVPAGEFIQGSQPGVFVGFGGAEFNIPPDEQPQRTVYLDAFYMDRVETSNAHYQACVEAGVCQPPRRTDCCTEFPGAFIEWPEYFGNPEFDDHPVIFITWYDARDFCEWRGARLATEAEWEKASRGEDGRIYPWGNEPPTPELINLQWPPGTFDERPLFTTTPVESYPEGASPYGILNLAGNVYEWVSDVYDQEYYSYAPDRNPPGPSEEDGTYRVTRGGSFWNTAYRNRSANRNNAFIPAESFHFDGGVRCALDAPEAANAADVP